MAGELKEKCQPVHQLRACQRQVAIASSELCGVADLHLEDHFKLSVVSKIVTIARASLKARDEIFPPADRS